MKKILYVTTISGFVPQFEMNDVRIMKEMGYEVHYASNYNNPIYTYEDSLLENEGIVKHQLDIAKSPLKLITNWKAIKQLIQVIDQEQIDMVHCHTPMGGVAARVAGHYSHRRPYIIYTAHGFHFYKGASAVNWMLYYTVEKLLARWTDTIITINREDYERARSKFKLKKNGFVAQIHGVGVDKERFKPRPERKQTKREELGIPEGALHIVTSAEINNNKNQKVIIEAMETLGREDIYYSICGKGPNYENLKELVERKNLWGQVRFLGFRTDMEEILQTADIFAFPSKREGLGMAAIEALSCGVPVVAAENRGSREYIINNSNGILCDSNDVDGFARAIEQMESWAGTRSDLAACCRESVEKFCASETMQTMRDVYLQASLQG